MMNKKGQGSGAPVAVIVLVMIFVLNWALWLGKWIGEIGQSAIDQQNLTGVEAFAFGNLNLFIFIALILGTMAWIYLGQNG